MEFNSQPSLFYVYVYVISCCCHNLNLAPRAFFFIIQHLFSKKTQRNLFNLSSIKLHYQGGVNIILDFTRFFSWDCKCHSGRVSLHLFKKLFT